MFQSSRRCPSHTTTVPLLWLFDQYQKFNIMCVIYLDTAVLLHSHVYTKVPCLRGIYSKWAETFHVVVFSLRIINTASLKFTITHVRNLKDFLKDSDTHKQHVLKIIVLYIDKKETKIHAEYYIMKIKQYYTVEHNNL